MNFAPYQDSDPEQVRALSPPPANRSSSRSPRPQSPQNKTNSSYQPVPPSQGQLPNPSDFEGNSSFQGHQSQQSWQRGQDQRHTEGFGNGVGADEERGFDIDVFATSLPMRLDFEACLAYLLLPPAGGAMLLIFERRSDYVRFHAWQSSLLFTFLFLIHLIFSFSRVISFMLLFVDVVLIAWLTSRAYRDADTLERCEVPFFGRLAAGFVDEE